MRIRLFFSLSALLIQCFSLNVYASELKDIFALDQRFMRVQAKSPVYLQWGPQDDSQNNLGFQLHVFKTKKNIGFVQAEICLEKESVLLRVVTLEDQTYAPEMLATLTGVFKASQMKLPPEIKYLCHVCGHKEDDLINASQETGFKKKIAFSSLFEVFLEKKIPPHTVPFVQKVPKAQDTPLVQIPFPFQEMTLCSLRTGRTPFVVGQKVQNAQNKEIYFEYAHGINVEAVMELSMLEPGFKMFRSKENDEIGYIVPNYLPELGDVRIGAVWIKENMRRRGYCLSAMRTLMSLYASKKEDFPQAKYFSFYTTRDNTAMMRVAAKLNFKEKSSSANDPMVSLLGGVFFTKSI